MGGPSWPAHLLSRKSSRRADMSSAARPVRRLPRSRLQFRSACACLSAARKARGGTKASPTAQSHQTTGQTGLQRERSLSAGTEDSLGRLLCRQ